MGGFTSKQFSALIIADPVKLGHARIDKSFYLGGELAPSQITANQDNYHPTGLENAAVLFLTSDAARSISGISFIATPVGVPAHPLLGAPITGRLLYVYNGGGFNITLLHNSGLSQAENKMLCWANANAVLVPGKGALLHHSTLAGTIWVQIGSHA